MLDVWKIDLGIGRGAWGEVILFEKRTQVGI